ncbi:hypothetical protein VTL71DRAFT_413 [Oculimacula yallundae]|uniref:Uncharacterized protein n=1 Tax=Oculimacula yallundae TaxID=86028 RepID=A0ABR4D034_9HELO
MPSERNPSPTPTGPPRQARSSRLLSVVFEHHLQLFIPLILLSFPSLIPPSRACMAFEPLESNPRSQPARRNCLNLLCLPTSQLASHSTKTIDFD